MIEFQSALGCRLHKQSMELYFAIQTDLLDYSEHRTSRTLGQELLKSRLITHVELHSLK